MSEVFISYSRKNLAFVEKLRTQLENADLGVWVDIEGLYAGEEFWPEVARAIDAALVVVFVITPDSIASRFCGQELDWAIEGQKRIVPLCHHDVDANSLHPELAKRQWVFFRDSDDPEQALNSLLSAVRADWVWLREQARFLRRAREWEQKNRDGSLLLRGRDLRGAEEWLIQSRGQTYGATPLHGEYIRASRRATKRRRLRLTVITLATLVTIALVTWFGLAQRVASLSNLSLDDLNRGQTAAAIDKLERANELCVNFNSVFEGCSDAGLNLGRAYLDAGRYHDALIQLSQIIDELDDAKVEDSVAEDFRATAYQNRAYTRIMLAETQSDHTQRLDEYARAENDLNTAAAIYERTPAGTAGKPIAITRARIHLGRGQYTQALQELDRAGRMSDSPDIDLLLSVVHHCLGDGPKSVEHFRVYIDNLPGRIQNPHWLRHKTYYSGIRERCTSTDEH